MKPGCMLLAILLLSPAGCSYAKYGIRNIFWTPVDVTQDSVFHLRLRMLAHEAWRQEKREDPERRSHAYADGFVDGFVDYVDANGDGEPPPRAPKFLRWRLLSCEDGQHDIEDWFDGFRRGAQVARERGLREQVVMPVGQEPRPPRSPVPAQVIVPVAPKELPNAAPAN